ncbi:MAG TPA: M10 family metallopeptidase C-terminal domain-containing protein [Allosphingosinicella sp.]|nr:M10 family metallopeptidase C-terminal domain-containing protein [Allosphingosinicella sp.]
MKPIRFNSGPVPGHAEGCPCCADLSLSVREDYVSARGGVLLADSSPFLLTDYAGVATWAGKPIYDQEQVIGQIDSGRSIAANSGKITYSFLTTPTTVGVYNNPLYGFPEGAGYTPLSDAEKAVARQSMTLWDDLIPQTFVEKKGVGADIVIANTTTGPAQAWAYYPGEGYKFQGDVWTADPDVNWTNAWLGYGGYGRTTLIHEIGHSLGLSHPGDYNFGDDNDGDGQPDPITYEADAFYAQDTKQYTIMSYFTDQKSGAQAVDVNTGLLSNPQTPLLDDILTIQAKYGADPTTRSGDTVYFANSTAGNAVYDLEENPFPYLAVYDAGGIDTFDFSTANDGVFVDLRPGSFSSATKGHLTLDEANAAVAEFNEAADASQGQPDFALWTAASYSSWIATITGIGANRVFNDTGVQGVTATSHRNIAIAYNTIIENAKGGSARDYLSGNNVANILEGNGGDDVLSGLGGNDTLNGGDGSDTVSYTSATAGVTVSLADPNPHVTVEGSDTFISIENLTGSDFNDSLTGDGNANVLEGGNGADALDGGAGIDTASYAGSFFGVTADLMEIDPASLDDYTSIENLLGSNFNDVLMGDGGVNVVTGGAGNDVLLGGLGNDTLDGGAGLDTVSYKRATAGVNVSLLAANPHVTVEGSDTFVGIENLTGSDFDDVLTGNAGNNILEGGLGNDTLDGGAGTGDQASYAGASTGVVVSLLDPNPHVTAAGSDVFIGIEGLVGSAFADVLTGNAAANPISGGSGDDIVNGGAGNDALNGDAGNDTLNGEANNDTLNGGDGNDLLNGGLDADTLNGGNGNDALDGGDGNDTLAGNAGDDTLIGGAGLDIVTYAAATGDVTVDLSLLTAQDTGGNGIDTLSGFESLIGSNFNDELTGDAGNNGINGGAGVDEINGGDGNDTLFGGAGNDTVNGDAQDDLLFGDAGNDKLNGGDGIDVLNGGTGGDQLTGGAGNDVFAIANIGAVDLILDFASGADKIDLSAIDADVNTAGNQAFTFIGGSAFGNVAGQLRSFTEDGQNYVEGDVNGDGVADFIVGVGSATVVVTDFLL